MGTLTVQFYSNLVQRYNVVFLRKLQIFVKIDKEINVLEDSIFLKRPPRKCCHGNSKGSTLKLLPFNKFLFIFKKSHQIWLNYLSPSLSYGQKTQGWCRTPPPPGRIGLNVNVTSFYCLLHFEPAAANCFLLSLFLA